MSNKCKFKNIMAAILNWPFEGQCLMIQLRKSKKFNQHTWNMLKYMTTSLYLKWLLIYNGEIFEKASLAFLVKFLYYCV